MTTKSSKKSSLIIKNLHVKIEDQTNRKEKKEILKGLDLEVKEGEIHAIMGPNGSGKSTLLNALMGHPKYEISDGTIQIETDGKIKKLNDLKADERANLGLFMAFQHPIEIPGLSFLHMLRTIKNLKNTEKQSLEELLEELKTELKKLKIDEKALERGINEGFSGGEKKKLEIFQMKILKPKFILLDEIDSGLDIDSLKIVAENIKDPAWWGKKHSPAIIIVTHYARILKFIKPHKVHILSHGKIIKSGGKALAQILEKSGYTEINEE
ncbi:Fe-S cluster assembly ATPase SufC [Candidatus Gracilibacteria bacterium]|jgi:Fe-S cluster assembly ATP-binding protein|nr:Fe-S cluster assembly ATPase SufC [Candidatus Gracilibacteria bacterium]